MEKLIQSLGFDSVHHFTESTFHPKISILAIGLSSLFASLAYYFEHFIGFEPLVGLVMLGLFIMELFTGVKASIKEGQNFKTVKFGRAWIKMGLYLLLIGFAHLLAVSVKIKPIMGLDFNYYEWMHYAFFNFVLIQLFISNIENFNRLGWSELVPLLGKLSKFLKLDKKDDTL